MTAAMEPRPESRIPGIGNRLFAVILGAGIAEGMVIGGAIVWTVMQDTKRLIGDRIVAVNDDAVADADALLRAASLWDHDVPMRLTIQCGDEEQVITVTPRPYEQQLK